MAEPTTPNGGMHGFLAISRNKVLGQVTPHPDMISLRVRVRGLGLELGWNDYTIGTLNVLQACNACTDGHDLFSYRAVYQLCLSLIHI